MRRLAALASAALAIAMAVLAVVTALPAGASTPLQDAAAAINRGQNVFVSSAVPGYSQAIANIAPAQSSPTVLVEMPATAILDMGGDGQQFADALDAATGYKYIVAVAFVSGTPPNENVTYNTATRRLPPGLAASLLAQAESAGRGPESTLSNFAHFTDDTLNGTPSDLLPIPTPSTSAGGGGTPSSPSTSSSKGSGVLKFGLVALILLVVIGLLAFLVRGRRSGGDIKTSSGSSERLPDPPERIMTHIRKIRHVIPQLQDLDEGPTAGTLGEICNRLYILFDTLNSYGDDPQDRAHKVAMAVQDYDNRLPRIVDIAELFARMLTRGPELWHGNPRENLDMARSAITACDRELLEAIRDANDGILRKFQIDTRFLHVSAR